MIVKDLRENSVGENEKRKINGPQPDVPRLFAQFTVDPSPLQHSAVVHGFISYSKLLWRLSDRLMLSSFHQHLKLIVAEQRDQQQGLQLRVPNTRWFTTPLFLFLARVRWK